MNKRKSLWIVIPFLIIIFGFGIVNVVVKDREISISENRTLKQFEQLKDGNFTGEFEIYYADQFVLRDEILKLYTKAQIYGNKTKVRDYFIYNNEWILENPDITVSEEDENYSADIINTYSQQFKERGKEVYYISLPHKSNVLKFMYPKYIKNSTIEENKDRFLTKLDNENINVLDLSEKFINNFSEEELKQLYFKTDHHWNGFGAFIGFKFIVEYLNDTIGSNIKIDEKDYESYVINDKSFMGSYNSNLYGVMPKSESIPYVYKNGTDKYEYKKNYDGSWFAPVESSIIVASSINNDKVEYGGAYTYDDHYYQIVNENALTDKSVLVIRDSYHSAMSWLLADVFKEVEVVDPRHIKSANLTSKEILERSNADVVLFMYNELSSTGIIPELNN